MNRFAQETLTPTLAAACRGGVREKGEEEEAGRLFKGEPSADVCWKPWGGCTPAFESGPVGPATSLVCVQSAEQGGSHRIQAMKFHPIAQHLSSENGSLGLEQDICPEKHPSKRQQENPCLTPLFFHKACFLSPEKKRLQVQVGMWDDARSNGEQEREGGGEGSTQGAGAGKCGILQSHSCLSTLMVWGSRPGTTKRYS